ncbi:hypothetical protein NBRC10512_000802 [Rhodotorula toruloides]|uniref:RHTO0S06e08548g1_1 n=2 Tax=Rhodotorula toruloides TaxID=5286 RepID=A0A061AWJ0_RHOTO|nr:uncharacterized protein RHTO_06366 [Rhodotorula toruloides NP11]EMS24362.1 hypothetical protein RHTO_06366 [Rhodotorula toruloides NP11]CDR41990.1 RHTO0S06e08548g1_1 [Rhodotorula toruloides]
MVNNATIKSNLTTFMRPFKGVLFPDTMPTGYESLAGQEVLPKGFLGHYLSVNKRFVVVTAIKRFNGVTKDNNSSWRESAERTRYVSHAGGSKLPAHLKEFDKQGNAKVLQDGDKEFMAICLDLVINKIGFMSFQELKDHSHAQLDYGTGLGGKATIIVGLLAYYLKKKNTTVVMCYFLGSSTIEDIKTIDIPTRTYSFDPENEQTDVSQLMWKIGQELGYGEKTMSKITDRLSKTMFQVADPTAIDEKAADLMRRLWKALALDRRATILLQHLPLRIKAAVDLRNGNAYKARLESGYGKRFETKEYLAVLNYAIKSYKDDEDFCFRDAMLAVCWTSNYKRTTGQVFQLVSSRAYMIVDALLEAEVEPTHIYRPSRLVNLGYVQDTSVVGGWRYASDESKTEVEEHEAMQIQADLEQNVQLNETFEF